MRLRTFKRSVVTALVLTCGCSWITVNRAPPESAWQEPRLVRCDTDTFVAKVDVGLGVAYLLPVAVGIGALTAGPSPDAAHTNPVLIAFGSALVAIGVAGATLFGSSAYYGFSEATRCEKYLDWRQLPENRRPPPGEIRR